MLAFGLGLGVAGGAALFVAASLARDSALVLAAVGLYAAALPTMFLCALLFGAAYDSPRRGFFRRLDHAAIFAMIAATATPFAVELPGWNELAFAALIWAAAAVGIFFKLRYPIGRADRSVTVFGLSGWAVMLLLAPTIASRRVLALLLLGGVLYTIGMCFHLWRRLRYHRAIWHVFVVAAAAAHFVAVAAIVG